MPAETKLRRDGQFEKWFKDHPLFLLRGRDAGGVNTYADPATWYRQFRTTSQ